MAVGRRHAGLFARHARPTWERYADQIGADLIVFDRPLDPSDRRPISWQKCLAMTHPRVMRYQQAAWLDSDILIRPHARNLFDAVPPDTVGAVDAYNALAKIALEWLYREWDRLGVPYIDNRTASLYHANYGLPTGLTQVAQCGVLVMTPELHAPILRHVYDTYEDRGGAEWNYEMRPLSYELQRQATLTWLHPGFNTLWSTLLAHQYRPAQPTPVRSRLHAVHRRWAPWFGRERVHHERARNAIALALQDCDLLHFAGYADEIRHYVPHYGQVTGPLRRHA